MYQKARQPKKKYVLFRRVTATIFFYLRLSALVFFFLNDKKHIFNTAHPETETQFFYPINFIGSEHSTAQIHS